MKEPIIKIVKDNKDKQKSYTEVKARYKMAMNQGFYGEALLINYAIIEDRLKSFLYYSGGMLNKNDISVSVDNPLYIETFGLREDKDKNGNLTGKIIVKDISKKINIIKKVLKVAKNYEGEDEYLLLIKQGLGTRREIEKFAEALKSLEKRWSQERNEITHGLLNKNTQDLKSKYEDICKRGKDLADYLDNTVKTFKNRVKIRQYLKL